MTIISNGFISNVGDEFVPYFKTVNCNMLDSRKLCSGKLANRFHNLRGSHLSSLISGQVA